MTGFLIVEPLRIAAIAASRGTAASNLTTSDPKEVWADSATGTVATITVDLGEVRALDTIYLGNVRAAGGASTWRITGGLADPAEQVIQQSSPLRVPDNAGETAETTCALWHGNAVAVRFLALSILQPVGAPLTAGVLAIGRSWSSAMGQEWDFGRRPIDTGSATALDSGGFSTVAGVRTRGLTWSFGDLTVAEVDALEGIALRLGITEPAVVIEDASRTIGLRGRCHWGLFTTWRPFVRRNRAQTRWELGFEEWK